LADRVLRVFSGRNTDAVANHGNDANLQQHIDAFFSAYNQTATPKNVYQRRFKNRRVSPSRDSGY
jgi:hypothetical protein